MSTEQPAIERFNAFDAAAIAEGKRPAPKDFNESRERLHELIDHLPQRALIQDHHATAWVDRTMQIASERMTLELGEENATIGDVHAHCLWHVRRASAVGGSEIGTIVKHFRGETGNFTNARNLVMDKLLIMSPMPGTEEMSRGVRAEPIIQKMYLDDRKLVSDEESLEILKGFRWEKLPFMVGTPDDLCLPLDGDPKMLKITDYKCPSADVNAEYEKNGISFDYRCQVHHYAILCHAAKVFFRDMEIACFDPRSFKMISYPVELDTELIREMMKAAQTFWNDFVMEGVLPEVPGPAKLEVDNQQMRDLATQLTVMKIVEDEIKNRKAELQSRIKAIGDEANELSEGKLDLGYAAFTRKRTWKEDELIALATAAGVDLEDHQIKSGKLVDKQARKMFKELFECHEQTPDELNDLVGDMIAAGLPEDQKLDQNSVIEALKGLEVDILPAMDVSESFRLSTKKKGPEVEALNRLKAEGADLADNIETIIEDNATKLLEVNPEDIEMEVA